MAQPHGPAERGCSFFGCGTVEGTARIGDSLADAVAGGRERRRLFHMEELDADTLDRVLTARGRERRASLKASGLMGACVAAGPLFSSAGCAHGVVGGGAGAAGPPLFPPPGGGRVHVVESSPQTVRLGTFDGTLPNVVEIDPGDTVLYPSTWSHFLDRMQPGVGIDQLAQWRKENPGKGPHSIIGPVGVRGARPGDLLEIQYHRILPKPWAANFNNPGALGTGALADAFPEGQVKYFTLDLQRMTAPFSEDIALPLAPFQGTLGVAPPDGFFGTTGGVVSSVPPGPHGGNLDLRELTEGARLFLPVWRPGAKIFTGDSHALQGDGEVNLTALETAMQELRIRVLLHPQVGWKWPFAETSTHWIALGLDKDLGNAFRLALENAIEFLSRRGGLTRLDAYSLCSLAVSFRITQVVDVNKGVHAMIPKSLFSDRLRPRISIA